MHTQFEYTEIQIDMHDDNNINNMVIHKPLNTQPKDKQATIKAIKVGSWQKI